MIHESHWGDIVGLFLICLGVFTFQIIDHVLGASLVSSGLIALKLKSVPKNGGT